MKFLADNDSIIIVKIDPKIAWECYVPSLKVTPYFMKAPTSSSTTQTKPILDIPEKYDNTHQIYNI